MGSILHMKCNPKLFEGPTLAMSPQISLSPQKFTSKLWSPESFGGPRFYLQPGHSFCPMPNQQCEGIESIMQFIIKYTSVISKHINYNYITFHL